MFYAKSKLDVGYFNTAVALDNFIKHYAPETYNEYFDDIAEHIYSIYEDMKQGNESFYLKAVMGIATSTELNASMLSDFLLVIEGYKLILEEKEK